MKKLIPADTVDAAGNVWETTGENIRNGVREVSERDVKLLVNVLFPVGSLYCGENSFILNVGKWEIIAREQRPIVMSTRTSSGESISSSYVNPVQQASSPAVALRMWKRVA